MGCLTGLARVKFDIGGQRPQRFRLIYRRLDDTTREIIAIGPREEHAIYRLAASRLAVVPPYRTGACEERLCQLTIPLRDVCERCFGRHHSSSTRSNHSCSTAANGRASSSTHCSVATRRTDRRGGQRPGGETVVAGTRRAEEHQPLAGVLQESGRLAPARSAGSSATHHTCRHAEALVGRVVP